MRKKIVGVTVGTSISPESMRNKMQAVKTINDIAPDEDGNVEVKVSAEAGYSPSARVQQTTDGAVISIIDQNGYSVARVFNGTDGRSVAVEYDEETCGVRLVGSPVSDTGNLTHMFITGSEGNFAVNKATWTRVGNVFFVYLDVTCMDYLPDFEISFDVPQREAMFRMPGRIDLWVNNVDSWECHLGLASSVMEGYDENSARVRISEDRVYGHPAGARFRTFFSYYVPEVTE